MVIAEELDLTLEIVASSLTEEGVHQFKEKFDFTVDIRLEAPGEDECIT